MLGRVLGRAEVLLFADGLHGNVPAPALFSLVPDLDGAVASALGRLGSGARVAVMPEGPLTVATVRTAT